MSHASRKAEKPDARAIRLLPVLDDSRQLDRASMIGDTVEHQDGRFEVTAAEGHGVGECVVDPLQETANPDCSAATL